MPAMVSILKKLKDAGWGPTRLAAELKIKPQAVSQWDEAVPAHRVPRVSMLTGVPMHELNPEMFGATEQEKAS